VFAVAAAQSMLDDQVSRQAGIFKVMFGLEEIERERVETERHRNIKT
jgi:hypothetical protein